MKFIRIILILIVINACKTADLSKSLTKYVQKSNAFSQSFSGFSIVELENKKIVFEKNADHYFTPASNTKIFTLLAGLKILDDKATALKYIIKNDSLIFWGTADPSFLHPDLPINREVFNFLKSRNEKLFYSNQNFKQNSLGIGWAWDDYNDYYQPELTSLPIYGNIVRFENSKNELKINPSFFKDIQFWKSEKNGSSIKRDLYTNKFELLDKQKANTTQDVPFVTSDNLLIKLLADTLHREIGQFNLYLPDNAPIIKSIAMDSIYQRMMYESDNLIAEQIMLMCANKVSKSINTAAAIDTVLNRYLKNMPDKPIWLDGSGLSRYNLVTPRTFTTLLTQLHLEFPSNRLFNIFSIGGKSGSLKNRFKSQKPYVFAKTGSMSNVFNLSGYIITKSGKLLAFSVMNNNFVKPMREIVNEVELFLNKIHADY